jgi:hypothetical protein
VRLTPPSAITEPKCLVMLSTSIKGARLPCRAAGRSSLTLALAI